MGNLEFSKLPLNFPSTITDFEDRSLSNFASVFYDDAVVFVGLRFEFFAFFGRSFSSSSALCS